MKLYLVKGDYLDQTSYILVKDSFAVAFDIGVSYDVVKRFIDDNGLTLLGVFITHAHFDHALGAAAAQASGCKIYSSEYGHLVSNTNKDLGRFMGVDFVRYVQDVSLKDGQTVDLDPFKITCYYTPGHTVDGACFLVDDLLFGGDTFCGESFGRFDFPTGDLKQLILSLDKIFSLDPTIKVLHGHETVNGKGIFEYSPKYTLAQDKERYSFDFFKEQMKK